MLEPDTVKEIKAEERAYEQWERETKNHILSIANPERKRKLWQKYFGTQELQTANNIF